MVQPSLPFPCGKTYFDQCAADQRIFLAIVSGKITGASDQSTLLFVLSCPGRPTDEIVESGRRAETVRDGLRRMARPFQAAAWWSSDPQSQRPSVWMRSVAALSSPTAISVRLRAGGSSNRGWKTIPIVRITLNTYTRKSNGESAKADSPSTLYT